ncbi:MAG: hypothetical protein IKD03_03150, partial [Clostridia bacterium]|nr:hypothetical protein [Clostridia bacterium]
MSIDNDKTIEKLVAKKGVHSGHRERMRQRFFATGIEGFASHEVLEFLLFFAQPRCNTNEIAHALIEA